jgi:hypothetical protein
MNEDLRKALEALTTAYGWAKADAEACERLVGTNGLADPYHWRQEYIAAAIRSLPQALNDRPPR